MGLLDALGLKPRRPAGSPTAATVPATAALDAALASAGSTSTQTASGSGVDKNQAVYDKARAAIQGLVDGLNKHPQKARIAAQIGQASGKLTTADTHAGKKEWGEAAKRLGEAKTICEAAKKLAEAWVKYAAKRGEALALVMSFDSSDPTVMTWVNALLAAADGFANATPPDFASALKKLQEITTKLKPWVEELLKTVKARLATVLKSSAAVQAFAKEDIDRGKSLVDAGDKAFAAGEWSQCRVNTIAAMRVLGPAVRLVERRGTFDKQRAATVAAIAQVKASEAIKGRAAALDATLAQADALAAHDTRKFEEGARMLQDLATRAAMWKKLESTITAATRDLASADAALAALDKHANAAAVAAPRDAHRKALVLAKGLMTKADTAADPAQAWAQASTALARVQADVAATAKLADGLGSAGAAQAAAAKPGDAAGLQTALDKLVADGKQAMKAAGAKQATDAFKRFAEHSAAATAALKDKDNAKAAQSLDAAAKALAAAKTIQSEHGQFATRIAGVEAELKALKASSRAAAIKSRIDPVATALADAKAKDDAHDGPGALAALRAAHDAVAAAKAADRSRASFDSDASALDKRVAAIKDATAKPDLDKLAADAKKLADALDFAGAGKALKKLSVALDKIKLEATMKANPADPAIAKMAAKMVEDGGGATVDGMIQAVPDGGDVKLINALAQGRYGVKFKSDAPLAGGDQAKAMKAVCAMFAKIPEDVRHNPSIRGVSHEDAIGQVGGAHNYDDATVSMQGRPGVSQQKFGAAQTSKDPVTGASVAQLPAAVEAKCQPKNNTPVDFLSFAAAHEVGHGVDDKRGFMATHGSGEKYGGWLTFGSGLQALADTIGGDARFAECYKTAEQKLYILNKLMSKPATVPAAAAGSPADNARIAFDGWYAKATSPNIYRRQADSESLKIGKHIYQEAYPRTWVGYLATARNQALTGYQFRAPAEWFAELYAGYRSGKLKDDHPAMDWLKKL
jgi:hypothetical protein